MESMGKDKKFNIMVVDDHSIVLHGVSSIINGSEKMRVCCEASSIKDMLKVLESKTPDLILLDNKLPDGEGIKTCFMLKHYYPDVKVIILTAFMDQSMVKEAIEARVDGYILKTIDRKAILGTVETVLNGGDGFSRELLVNLVKDKKETFEDLDRLTGREIEILELVALGLKNKAIAKELFIAEKTVRNYLSNLMRKLGVNNRTEAAIYWKEKRTINKDI